MSSRRGITVGSAGIVVAVLDTGVRFDHPDLLPVASGGNLLPGYDMISDVDTANDGNGRDADASDPGDWLTQAEISKVGGPFYQCDTSPENSSWHGTQTAGLIAALTNNGVGMASVGRNVRVLPVRVLGKCGGFDSDILAGMRWAAGQAVPGVPANQNPRAVISMSLGGDGACDVAYHDAVNQINAAGAVVVVAAGNRTMPSRHRPTAPASSPWAHCGTSAPRWVSRTSVPRSPSARLAAIASTPIGIALPVSDPDHVEFRHDHAAKFDIYRQLSLFLDGTSFSAPLVAGTIADAFRTALADPDQTRVLLQATARPFPTTGGDPSYGLWCNVRHRRATLWQSRSTVRVLLHHRYVRRRHARRGRRSGGG